jgi:hypothetical protein
VSARGGKTQEYMRAFDTAGSVVAIIRSPALRRFLSPTSHLPSFTLFPYGHCTHRPSSFSFLLGDSHDPSSVHFLPLCLFPLTYHQQTLPSKSPLTIPSSTTATQASPQPSIPLLLPALETPLGLSLPIPPRPPSPPLPLIPPQVILTIPVLLILPIPHLT